MNLGKVSQTVYRRSILKQLNKEEDTALFRPGQEESCCGIRAEEGKSTLFADVSLYGNEKDLCVFAMAQAVNHLASRGAQPKGAAIRIQLPEYAYESRLKAMVAMAADAAKEQGLLILSAEAEALPMIQTTIVHVTAVGSCEEANLLQSRRARSNQDIVLLNRIALEGTLRIRREKEEELAGRFAPAYLNRIEHYRPEIFAVREMRAAAAMGVSAMHQITDGGILAALWDLAEGAGIGLEVDLKKIAVRQETIEVCECFHLNPYQLTSAGSVLVTAEKGEELADALNRQGMSAVVIGRTTAGNDRVIQNGEEKRFLDRPAPDELTKIWK